MASDEGNNDQNQPHGSDRPQASALNVQAANEMSESGDDVDDEDDDEEGEEDMEEENSYDS